MVTIGMRFFYAMIMVILAVAGTSPVFAKTVTVEATLTCACVKGEQKLIVKTIVCQPGQVVQAEGLCREVCPDGVAVESISTAEAMCPVTIDDHVDGNHANPTVQVGGWFAGDKVGGLGGLRLDLVLEWNSFHFQIGGGVGGSSSGLAWMADAMAFAKLSKLISFGGGLLAEADASDLAETDHALFGVTPALQIHSNGFVFEILLPIGGLVRPGGEWEFSVGGVASAMYRF